MRRDGVRWYNPPLWLRFLVPKTTLAPRRKDMVSLIGWHYPVNQFVTKWKAVSS